MNRRRDRGKVSHLDLAQVFGIQAFRQGSEADQVGEEHCHPAAIGNLPVCCEVWNVGAHFDPPVPCAEETNVSMASF